jgi:hypothetical protein
MQLKNNPNAEQFATWLLQIASRENSDEKSKVKISEEMCSDDIESEKQS